MIYELKQINSSAKVSVKLVSGANIGTIAVGVAKAGADIIHISGSDGGTGAASLSSMKHCGLPFEFGLLEVHRALLENKLREQIILRADGGLNTGKDIIIAALLGADEYDFGKLILIAQGCVMARVCEKNTCPTGIATHDPKFKAKYKGNKDEIITLLSFIAEEVREHLSVLGYNSIEEVIGKTDLLQVATKHLDLITNNKLDLSFFLSNSENYSKNQSESDFSSSKNIENKINPLNKLIVDESLPALEYGKKLTLSYPIETKDRAILSTLSGKIAQKRHETHLNNLGTEKTEKNNFDINITFNGSAGQSFGVFMVEGLNVKLYGEANDSVCKSMSGGKTVIVPSTKAKFKAEKNVIIGNCALYGATGGTLYVKGIAGDRFAVRNSGALSVVEGTGLHTCEYMTNGTVVILGNTGKNLGSGMTGGKIYLFGETQENEEYITSKPFTEAEYDELKEIIKDYFKETQSDTASFLLEYWNDLKGRFKKFVPIALA